MTMVDNIGMFEVAIELLRETPNGCAVGQSEFLNEKFKSVLT